MGFLDGVLGAITGFATGGPVGAAVGGLGGLTSSKKSSKATNQASAAAQANQGQMSDIARQLMQRYQRSSPEEQAVLNYFMNRAGLGAGGNAPGGNFAGQIPGSTFGGVGGVNQSVTHAPLGTRSDLNGGQPFPLWGSRKTLPGIQVTQPAGTPVGGGGNPGLVNGNLGIYNSPQYQLLRQQAQEDIGRQQVNAAHQYGNSLLGRGMQNSSLMAGGQAAIAGAANKSYSDFARQLAMQAADKQDQLVGQLNGALQPSLNSAGTAGGLFSGAAGLGLQGQQVNQAQQNLQSSALGSAIGNAAQYWGLKGSGGGGNGTDGGVGGVQGSSTTADQAYNQAYGLPDGSAAIPHDAHGGPVQAGQPVVVGDGGGAERYVPNPNNPLDRLATSTFGQWLLHRGQALAQSIQPGTPANAAQWNQMRQNLTPSEQAAHDFYTPAVRGFIGYHNFALPPGGQYRPPTPDMDAAEAYMQTLDSPEMLVPGAPGYIMPHRAMGGPVAQGQPVVVGDGGGPESFVPRNPLHLFPDDYDQINGLIRETRAPYDLALRFYKNYQSGMPLGHNLNDVIRNHPNADIQSLVQGYDLLNQIGRAHGEPYRPMPAGVQAGLNRSEDRLNGMAYGDTFGSPDFIRPGLLPHRAMGGPVTAGQAYQVGERGPEGYVVGSRGPSIFTPPQDGYIIPNPRTPNGPAGSLTPGHLDPRLDPYTGAPVAPPHPLTYFLSQTRG